MSLRVLLADESPSIKKAFELALQDFGVKIQTVHQGVDVLELYREFKPDICFMDILLPKLNGYEASLQLKLEDDAAATPIVLMWSGFMELDPEKFKSSKANSDIEKPFETERLRSLVKKLVPKLGNNELSDHLIMEEPAFEDDTDGMPDIPQLRTEPESKSEMPPLTHMGFDATDSDDTPPMGTSLDDLEGGELNLQKDENGLLTIPDLSSLLDDDSEDFDSESFSMPEALSSDSANDLPPAASDSSDEWLEQSFQDKPSDDMAPEGLSDVDAFSMESLNDSDDLPFEAPAENSDDDDMFTVPEGLNNIDLPPMPDQVQSVEALPEDNENSVESLNSLKPDVGEEVAEKPSVEALKTDAEEREEQLKNIKVPELTKEELKRLILAQSKDIIESVVWDVVPELAKEMIQKEIQRLTGDVKYEGDLR